VPAKAVLAAPSTPHILSKLPARVKLPRPPIVLDSGCGRRHGHARAEGVCTMRRQLLVIGLVITGAGCNRQDAECLGRIGTLVRQRLENVKGGGGADAGLVPVLP